MRSFDEQRNGTGAAEWAEVRENICIGCPNNCLYCYAAHRAATMYGGWCKREDWPKERLAKRAAMKSFPAKEGVVMFPSTHDITPFNVEAYIQVAKLILGKGNRLLIVSKPRKDCIERLISELAQWKGTILLRFTIGTMSPHTSQFWEPGAPLPYERLCSLKMAFDAGFETSVSIEPMLSGPNGAMNVVEMVRPFVTETIWIGKMNKAHLRVAPEHSEAVKSIGSMQDDKAIMFLYQNYKNDSIIRWKDSIKEVIFKTTEQLYNQGGRGC